MIPTDCNESVGVRMGRGRTRPWACGRGSIQAMHDHKPTSGSNRLQYEGGSIESGKNGIVIDAHIIHKQDGGDWVCEICGASCVSIGRFKVHGCEGDDDLARRALGTAERRLSDLVQRSCRDASQHIHAALAGVEETLEYGGEPARVRNIDNALQAAAVAAVAEETCEEIRHVRELLTEIQSQLEVDDDE